MSTIERVGETSDAIVVSGAGTDAWVKLDAGVAHRLLEELGARDERSAPARIELTLENVRGTRDAAVLNIVLHDPEFAAGSLALYGLRRASIPSEDNPRGGLTFVLDITDYFMNLGAARRSDIEEVKVSVRPRQPLEDSPITIDRIHITSRRHHA